VQEVRNIKNEEMIRSVQNMQDYIEEHILEPITLHQLAGAAGYSQWHSERIFKELIGRTPFEYIRACRLSQAAITLRDGKAKVIDVAFDFVFDSHEGFTKAFSRQFGLPPRRYSLESPAIPLFLPYRISAIPKKKEEEKRMSTQENTIFVQVVERPARKILIKRGVKAEDYFAFCDEAGCDVWGVLTSVKEALYEPVGMWLPEKMIPAGTSKYVQGVELPLSYDKKIPEGYEMIEVPPCKMMIFQGPAFKDEDFEDAITDMWALMKVYDPKLYGFEWADDDAPRIQLNPLGYRGYIEGRPVRSVSPS
jgi:AraC family transcriptional regulator